MTEQTMGLIFFLKRSRNKQSKLALIYARVTVKGIAKEWSIQRKWYADRWNQKIGRATDKKENAKSVNQTLDSLTAKFIRIKNELIDTDVPITAEVIKNKMTGAEVEKMLLVEFQNLNDQIFSLIGKEYAKGTHDRFVTARLHTESFILFKYQKTDLPIKSLNYEFISDFAHWLKTVRNCGHNTTVKYLTNMKRVVIQCKKKGWIRYDPFESFPLRLKRVEKPYLHVEELKRIMEKKFSTFRLTLVKDIFLFSCFTGLAFSDVKKLSRKDLQNVAGVNWILTTRTKTDTLCKIPILPQAQAILDKYVDHEMVLVTNGLLPIYSNQKMNAYLKEIAEVCGILKVLTFHVARHTFATIALRYGVSITSLAAILGHKVLAQTQHYAIVQQQRIEEEMTGIIGKLTSDLELQE